MRLPQEVAVHEFEVTQRSLLPVSAILSIDSTKILGFTSLTDVDNRHGGSKLDGDGV